MIEISRYNAEKHGWEKWSGTTLEMRLTCGGSFMMFPPIMKMGFYLAWTQNVSDTDQEFIVFLLERATKEKNPRVHETVSKHGTLVKPL